MANQNLKIVIGAVDKTKAAFASVAKSLNVVRKALFSFKTGIAAALGVGGLGLLIKSSMQSIDVLGKTASKLGITTQELQKMRYAAGLAGVETRTMDMALQRFTRRLSEAANDTGEAKDALKELGIDAQSFAKLPLEQQMIKLAGSFEKVTSEGDRVRLAFKLFDSEGVSMINILQDGSAALKEMFNDAENLGVLLSTSAVRGVEYANDEFSKLTTLFKGIVDVITAAVAPAFGELAEKIRESIQSFIKQSGSIEQFGKDLAISIINFTEKATIAFIEFAKAITRRLQFMIDVAKEFGIVTRDINISLDDYKDLGVIGFFEDLRKKVLEGTSAMENFNKSAKDNDKNLNDSIGALQEYAKAASEAKLDLQDLAVKGLKSVEDALVGVLTGANSAKDAFKSMANSIIQDLVRIHIQRTITAPIAQALSGFIPAGSTFPMKAMGGHVAANKPYIVGEKGAELFMPNQSGTIIPNNKMNGGGVTVNQTINVSTGVAQTVRAEIMQMMPQIAENTKAAVVDARRRGGSFAAAFQGVIMAISYPLSLPTVSGIARVNLRAVNAVSISESPFTFKQQVIAHSGQRWEAEISMPAMQRADAEAWISFLMSLNGLKGTFLLGDPNASTPRGSASTAAGTPVVNGADQTGDSLTIDGCPTSATGYLKAGDYIQIGGGSAATLHKVLTDTDTNASGQATLDIWPYIRTAPADDATVIVSNAKGLFRLGSNQTEWSINEAAIYGITFPAIEAIV